MAADEESEKEKFFRAAFELAVRIGHQAVVDLVRRLRQKQGEHNIGVIARAAAGFPEALEAVRDTCQEAREIGEYIQLLLTPGGKASVSNEKLRPALKLVEGTAKLGDGTTAKSRTAT